MLLLSILPHFPLTDPTGIVFVVLLVILLAPVVFERLRVPPIVGMIVAGIVVGPYGLNLLVRDQSFEIFGQVGLYYIMLLAGLSVDRSTLRGKVSDLVWTGLLSFGVPFALSWVCSLWILGLSAPSAGLVACILASHTLVSFSIVSRYGLSRHKGTVLSIAATVVSLFLSLLVLGGIVAGTEGTEDGTGGVTVWLLIVVKAAVFVAGLLLIYPRAIRLFFRNFSDEILQFIFVLVMVFLSASVAEWIGLQGVLGAFLAGIVFSRYIPETVPLTRHLDFVGNALFIPYFLIGVGMLIDLPAVFGDAALLWAVGLIVAVGLVGKALGAVAAGRLMGLKKDGRMLLIGLTSGHAAGALAMVMVGRRVVTADGSLLADDLILNASVLLILVSCIFSAFVTNEASRKIAREMAQIDEGEVTDDKILVAFADERTLTDLVNLSLMMRPHRSITPIVGVKLIVNAADGDRARDVARDMVKRAAQQMAVAGVNMKKVVRSGVNFVTALGYTLKDFEANEIIMAEEGGGEKGKDGRGHDVTGALTANVNRQIITLRLTRPLNTLRRLHVMVPKNAELEVGFHRWLRHVCRMARALDCAIVFHCGEGLWEHIEDFCHTHYKTVEPQHQTFDGVMNFDNRNGGDQAFLGHLRAFTNNDHLIIFVLARQGSLSYQNGFDQVREMADSILVDHSTMLIYPDQYGAGAPATGFSTGFSHGNE